MLGLPFRAKQADAFSFRFTPCAVGLRRKELCTIARLARDESLCSFYVLQKSANAA
jgi:hypothetical protein